MTQTIVHARVSRAAVRQAIARIPQESRGAAANVILTRCGLAALGRIRQAFITKARGGTDEAGDSWKPLSPKTIAYSRRGRSKTEKGRESRPSQALNTQQQERWWDLYRQGLAIYKGDKGSAAKRAWGILKKEGATTLFDKYGHRQVEILRDTGLLLNSLSPGNAGNILHVGNGNVVVGTSVKYAKYHHEGIPGRLPQRRLFPPPSKWPASWWADITEQAKQGLIDVTVQLIREAR